jgi:hypothetical protein
LFSMNWTTNHLAAIVIFQPFFNNQQLLKIFSPK